jgi:hypothetical protein
MRQSKGMDVLWSGMWMKDAVRTKGRPYFGAQGVGILVALMSVMLSCR